MKKKAIETIQRRLQRNLNGEAIRLMNWFEEGEQAEEEKRKFMLAYSECVSGITEEYGSPSYTGPGPCKLPKMDRPTPCPDDFGRVGDFTSWEIDLATVFLCVSSHDGDSARHLRIEITHLYDQAE